MSAVERRYAMQRLRSGVWLLPSNEGETMWILRRYLEDGSLGEYDEHGMLVRVVRGWFWDCAFWNDTTEALEALFASGDRVEWDERWCSTATLLATRAEAVEYALTARQRAVTA